MGTPASPSDRASAASGSDTHWKQSAYVGYSTHCPTPALKKVVREALTANTASRAIVMTCTEFCDFFFLEPKKGMNMGAFDTWRSRNGLRAFSVCPHTEEATAIEGLSVSMRPTSRTTNCLHVLPPGVGGPRPPLHSMVEQHVPDPSPIVEGASADGSHPGLSFVTLNLHRPRCSPALGIPPCVESLAPLLFGAGDRLVDRRKGHSIGVFLGWRYLRESALG